MTEHARMSHPRNTTYLIIQSEEPMLGATRVGEQPTEARHPEEPLLHNHHLIRTPRPAALSSTGGIPENKLQHGQNAFHSSSTRPFHENEYVPNRRDHGRGR